jgi:CRP-like cAMP-binding protein
VQIPDNGVQRTVNHLKENDFFGEMSLLTGQPRSATVVAEEETEVLQISKSALKPIFESNPELVRAIGEIVDERKLALGEQKVAVELEQAKAERGVLRSIKQFFGLR